MRYFIATVAGILTFAFILFLYWVSGADLLVRSDALAAHIFLATFGGLYVGCFLFMLLDLSAWGK